MRERSMRRKMLALGCPPFAPTDDQRFQVRVLAFNGVEPERIAAILEMREIELRFYFRRELDLSEDVFLAQAAATVIELASQRKDMQVALRAAEAMLRARSSRWREPKAAEAETAGKPVESMSLLEVDSAIAALERRRRDSAAAADAEAPAPDVEAQSG